jgi:uroporphyrinogen-III synthase
VTTTAEPDSVEVLDDAVRAVRSYAWVAVTSVNGVAAMVSAAQRTGTVLPPSPLSTGPVSTAGGSPRWAAVGPATAVALRAAGVVVGLEAAGTAEALAAAFPDPGDGENTRVLLPLGDLARSTLADGLRERGWDVRPVVAYRTAPCALPDDVVTAAQAGQIGLAVVAAGSGARELARQLGDDAPPVVTIGQPSARAATASGLDVVGVADHPTDEALAAAVTRAATTPAERRSDT